MIIKYIYMKGIQSMLCATLSLSVLLVNAQELRVSNGVNVNLDGPVHLVLDGMGITNHGQFKSNNGTLTFTGDSKSGLAFIGGSSPLRIQNIIVDRLSGDLQLQNNLFVDGSIKMIQGNLDLNNNIIDLGKSGFIEGETRTTRIIGSNGGAIRITTDLDRPQQQNPGNLGLQVSSDKYLGKTTITRGHLQQMNERGELSIERYYEMEPVLRANVQAEIIANFLDVETGNANTKEISLWKSNDGGRKWSSLNRANNNYVIDESIGNAPLRLAYFTGKNNAFAASFIQLYPNPVRDKFLLSFNYAKEEEIILNLYSDNGQLLESRRVKAFNGVNKLDWQVGKYPAGNYQLRFAGEQGRTLKFTKQ